MFGDERENPRVWKDLLQQSEVLRYQVRTRTRSRTNSSLRYQVWTSARSRIHSSLRYQVQARTQSKTIFFSGIRFGLKHRVEPFFPPQISSLGQNFVVDKLFFVFFSGFGSVLNTSLIRKILTKTQSKTNVSFSGIRFGPEHGEKPILFSGIQVRDR